MALSYPTCFDCLKCIPRHVIRRGHKPLGLLSGMQAPSEVDTEIHCNSMPVCVTWGPIAFGVNFGRTHVPDVECWRPLGATGLKWVGEERGRWGGGGRI